MLASDDLAEMFGIEIAPPAPPKRAAARRITTKPSTAANSEEPSRRTAPPRPAKLREPAPKMGGGKPFMTPAKRRAVSARMKKYWAARRALMKKTNDPESS